MEHSGYEPAGQREERARHGREETQKSAPVSHRRRGRLDIPMLLLTLILLTIGVIMVLSASFASAYYEGNSTYYFVRQLIFAAAGVFLMLLIALMPVGLLRRAAIPLFLGSVALLVLVIIIGKEENGAKRWISLGFTTFQPSEIAKVSVILADAVLICRYRKRMRSFRYGVLPFLLMTGAVVGLLVLEPHYSASIIILTVTVFMMFLGGTRPVYFLAGGFCVGGLGWIAYQSVDYVAARVNTWRDPFLDTTGDGWQTIQSLYAVCSGGFTGLGLGQSRQKYLWLPEEHNDFIFSVVCEELGYVGAALILVLFAMLVLRGFWIAVHARDRFSTLVAAGISGLLAVQVFLNVAVVTNLVPCTGISLPLFSYGGTALIIQLCEIGIVLSISRDIQPDGPVSEPAEIEEEHGKES